MTTKRTARVARPADFLRNDWRNNEDIGEDYGPEPDDMGADEIVYCDPEEEEYR